MSARPMERDDSSGPRSGFRAVLHDRQLADLVQMECLAQSKGVVRVSSGEKVGYLFFDGGRIVHAMTAGCRGEAAALEMLAWEEGTFEPTREPVWPSAPTIECSVQSLVLRAAIARDHAEPTHGSLVRPVEAASPGESAARRVTLAGQAPAEAALTSVRLDHEGMVIDCTEGGADYAPVAAYASRMAQLVGEALGVRSFSSVECVAPNGQCSIVCACPDGTIVGATAERDCELAEIRRRLRSEGAPL